MSWPCKRQRQLVKAMSTSSAILPKWDGEQFTVQLPTALLRLAGIERYHAVPADGEAHRMIAGQATVAIKGGVSFVSLYLHDSEGLSEKNLEVLEAAAAFLASIRGPWVVAADWNMTPETLTASGWPELVGGRLHVPAGPTCGTKCYDYFVADRGLSKAVAGVVRITDAGTNPHIPVRLLVRAADCRRKLRRLVKPPFVPGRIPDSGS